MLPLWLIRSGLSDNPARLGRWGERYACRYLRREGLRLIGRGFSCRYGEIDIIMAENDGAVVFVEVKTRISEDRSPVLWAVDKAKQGKIRAASKVFIGRYGLGGRAKRYDIVTIVLGETGRPRVRHYKNAF